MSLFAQAFDEAQSLRHAFLIGLRIQDGRAEVHVQADDADVRVADDALGRIQDGVDVESELDALDAGVGLGVRLGRQVGIDAQGGAGSLADAAGHLGEVVQFFLALDVEEKDVVFQGVANLGVGLADAGEDDFLADSAGVERPIQFAAAGHVEAGAGVGQSTAEVQIAVGLEAVADQRLNHGEGFLQLAEMVQQRRLAVDEQRRAVEVGQLADGHVFAVKYAVAVVKVIHDRINAFRW